MIRTLSLVALLAVLPAVSTLAGECPCHKAKAKTEVRQEEETPLAKEMSTMGKHFKLLKKNVAKADKKEANIKDFNAIAESAVKCKEHVPATANTDELKKKYADMLDQVAAAAKDGAKAVEEGKDEGAKKAFEALKKLQKDGHDVFVPKEK